MTALLVCPSVLRAGEWKQLPSLPDPEGFAGCYAGVSHGALLVAGGANFPGKKPWEGGEKIWYGKVFVLESPDGEWKPAGTLPRPLGYGVSVTHQDSVVCVGGSDALRHYADAFRLEWKQGRLVTTPLPSLPRPLANGCGALVGDTLFVFSGQETPVSVEAVNAGWTLDLAADDPRWKPMEPCPGGGRILPAAAGVDGAFWIAGGAGLLAGADGKAERRYLRDAYRYDLGKGWTRIADLPQSSVAAPSPAPVDAAGFYLLGGDDGSQLGTLPDAHRGFSRKILQYRAKEANWVSAGEIPAPRVTVPCVGWNSAWIVLSGEMRPGVRSPEVWSFRPGKPR